MKILGFIFPFQLHYVGIFSNEFILFSVLAISFPTETVFIKLVLGNKLVSNHSKWKPLRSFFQDSHRILFLAGIFFESLLMLHLFFIFLKPSSSETGSSVSPLFYFQFGPSWKVFIGGFNPFLKIRFFPTWG